MHKINTMAARGWQGRVSHLRDHTRSIGFPIVSAREGSTSQVAPPPFFAGFWTVNQVQSVPRV